MPWTSKFQYTLTCIGSISAVIIIWAKLELMISSKTHKTVHIWRVLPVQSFSCSCSDVALPLSHSLSLSLSAFGARNGCAYICSAENPEPRSLASLANLLRNSKVLSPGLGQWKVLSAIKYTQQKQGETGDTWRRSARGGTGDACNRGSAKDRQRQWHSFLHV